VEVAACQADPGEDVDLEQPLPVVVGRVEEVDRLKDAQVVDEHVDALDHPGIMHRGPVHARRAALAGGPDVWEVVARLREFEGGDEERIGILSQESDLHPRQIRIALDYAAERSRDVEHHIERNEAATAASQRTLQERRALLG
jgi:hypothetical protein